MTDCGLSLTSPTGGWIGTVAHIVGAEKTAARGAGAETPEERASFDNLILMCATHGREVDAPETGEANFPIDKLRQMKKAHETKVTEAVKAAIDQEVSGLQTATGAIDTTLRPSSAAATAEGLLESMTFIEGEQVAKVLNGLSEARLRLRRLSQPAVDTLAQLVGLWLQGCMLTTQGVDSFDFGDPSRTGPQLPVEVVDNRVINGRQATVDRAIRELKAQNLLDVNYDEYEGVEYYGLSSPWSLYGHRSAYNFWRCAADFLYHAHGVRIDDWLRGLDFSIFDRAAAPGRVVPWR